MAFECDLMRIRRNHNPKCDQFCQQRLEKQEVRVSQLFNTLLFTQQQQKEQQQEEMRVSQIRSDY